MMSHPTVNVGNDSSNDSDDSHVREKVVVMLTEGVPSDVRDVVLKRLAEQFGGFTLTESRGGWVNPDGELITERVTQVESVRMSDDDPDAKAVAQSTAQWVQEKTDEHSVMWEVREVSGGLEQ